MKHIIFAVLLALTALISAPALAAKDGGVKDVDLKPVAAVAAKTPDDAGAAADIARAEDFLQGLTDARARFLQTAPDGTQMIGTFYLSRPGRLRFNYDNSKDYVVADGYFIYFYDSQTRQQTNAPIGQTLADFLLRKTIKLSGDLKVESVVHTNGLVLIKVVQAKNPAGGSLTLAFADNPYRLKKWRVVDGAGTVTEVELFQLENNVKLDRGMFAYTDPMQGKTVHFNQ